MSTSLYHSFFLFTLVYLNAVNILADKLELAPLHITISSLYRESTEISSLIDREIQIKWSSDIEKIALYTEDPTTGSEPVIQFNTISYPEGFFQTNISLGTPVLPGGWNLESEEAPILGDHCLPVWVGGYSHNKLVYIDCLKIHPTWMQDNRLSIWNLPVSSLIIPGTHNSGCYKRGETLSHRDTTGRYLLTQDQDLWSQLVYGIRYIDLRVGYYPIRKNGTEVIDSDNSFWVNHDLIKVRPLIPLINQLKKFLQRAKDEIVILDLHRFPVGFTGRQNRHEKLIKFLERELRDFIIPFKQKYPTLENIWEQEGRLIVSYGESSVIKDKQWLWPPIKQLWGNQQTVEGLYSFINNAINETDQIESPRPLWAVMAHLTPSILDILFNPKGSLRVLANSVNSNLTVWCQKHWWDKVNIIATDFFLENNLIDLAIVSNIKKGNAAKKYFVN